MDTLQTPKTPLKTQKIRILGDAGILGGPGGLGSLTPIPGYGGCMFHNLARMGSVASSIVAKTILTLAWLQ